MTTPFHIPEASLYQHFVEALTEYGVFVVDVDGLVVSWNAGAEYITGVSAEEILGKSLDVLYIGADGRELRGLLDTMTREGQLTNTLLTTLQTQNLADTPIYLTVQALYVSRRDARHHPYRSFEGYGCVLRHAAEPIVPNETSAKQTTTQTAQQTQTHAAAIPHKESEGNKSEHKESKEEFTLEQERASRLRVERELLAIKNEFETQLNQRTDLLQEAIFQLQEEVARRDEVEGKLRQRTDIMHDFIQQLEQEMEERRKVEQTLRLSEERFRGVIERSPVGIAVMNEHGAFEYVNSAFCQIYGYTASEMMGEQLRLILLPHRRTLFEQAYKAAFQGGNHLSGEWDMRHKNGSAMTVLADTVLITSEPLPQSSAHLNIFALSNNFFHGSKDSGKSKKLIIFALDISERKRAENLLKRAAVIIDKSPAIIYQFSNRPGFPFEFVSENISQFGYSPHDITDSTVRRDALWYIHPHDRQKILKSFERLRKEPVEHLRREYRILTKSGEERWVEDTIIADKDAEGNVVSYQGVVFDITERKQAEEDMSKALEKEKELLELKARFVTIASHEFRTPLTTIMLAAGILNDFGSMLTDEQRSENLALIRHSVEHITQLLEDLLMFDKIDPATSELQLATLELRSWSEEFANRISHTMGRNYTLQYTLPEQPVRYVGDERLLKQMLERLLSNAFKYSVPAAEIQFDVATDTHTVTFTIHDTGIGIPEEDLHRIFEPFHRGANIGQIGGTGMGLAITKKLVELHRGSIAVDSQVGAGTTVTLTLPLELVKARQTDKASR
jgi:PAS domain S-box-containing protein